MTRVTRPHPITVHGPVTLTDLTGLYEIRPTKEETAMIKGHAETMEKIEDLEKRIPLDRPEQFLFEMSQVPQLEERIACFIFEDTFKGFGSRILPFVGDRPVTTCGVLGPLSR